MCLVMCTAAPPARIPTCFPFLSSLCAGGWAKCMDSEETRLWMRTDVVCWLPHYLLLPWLQHCGQELIQPGWGGLIPRCCDVTWEPGPSCQTETPLHPGTARQKVLRCCLRDGERSELRVSTSLGQSQEPPGLPELSRILLQKGREKGPRGGTGAASPGALGAPRSPCTARGEAAIPAARWHHPAWKQDRAARPPRAGGRRGVGRGVRTGGREGRRREGGRRAVPVGRGGGGNAGGPGGGGRRGSALRRRTSPRRRGAKWR